MNCPRCTYSTDDGPDQMTAHLRNVHKWAKKLVTRWVRAHSGQLDLLPEETTEEAAWQQWPQTRKS